MKKTNKKGFTLIELLAVIIILGVIMLIAIPSVTQQITNSRKNSYSDTLQSFVKGVVTEVNEGSIPMYDGSVVYAIPVGNNSDYSCIDLESGGASPFNKEYKYAYVLVRYTGSSYDYWITAVDGSNQGSLVVSSKDFEKEGSKYIHANITGNNTLLTAYGNTKYATGTITDELPTGVTAVPDGFTNIVKIETVAEKTAATASTTETKNNTDYWKDVVASNSTGNEAAYVYFVDPDSCRE